jgi:AcrR family transcriptional regulator
VTAVGLRERKKQRTRDALIDAALDLFLTRGYEATTVDQIAAEVEVSPRTFFRYFASKEDVVVRFLTGMGTEMRAALASRPLGERPSASLRHTVWVSMAACADHGDRALRVVQLILRTPALRARFLERQDQWRDDLAAELAQRLGIDSGTHLYPQLAAGMALTAFDAVLQRWSGSEGAEDPADLTDRAFATIAPALDSVG